MNGNRYDGHSPSVVAESLALKDRMCGDDKDPPGLAPDNATSQEAVEDTTKAEQLLLNL